MEGEREEGRKEMTIRREGSKEGINGI